MDVKEEGEKKILNADQQFSTDHLRKISVLPVLLLGLLARSPATAVRREKSSSQRRCLGRCAQRRCRSDPRAPRGTARPGAREPCGEAAADPPLVGGCHQPQTDPRPGPEGMEGTQRAAEGGQPGQEHRFVCLHPCACTATAGPGGHRGQVSPRLVLAEARAGQH